MKSSHCRLVTFFIILATAIAAAEAESIAATPPVILPPTNAVVMISISDDSSVTPSPNAATSQPDSTPNTWMDIKDCTSEMRGQFFAGLKRLEIILNNQIADLRAKRASQPGTSDAAALDAAIREIGNSRFFLIALGEALSRSTPETWEQQKAKVGIAWVKSQAAYTKINPYPTS